VYRRADLSRTMTLVVALLLTAVSTSALAREFRAADTQSHDQPLTGLATRPIDGAENNWPSFVTADHYGAAGYYTLTAHRMSPGVPFLPKAEGNFAGSRW